MTWIMYDSIDISTIPVDAHAVAGYVGGHWPTYEDLRTRFPRSHVLSIAVNNHEDAHCLDVEPGDSTITEAAAWVQRQRKRGVERPVIYCSVSSVESLLAMLRDAGIHRNIVRVWSAHYTNHPHVCNHAHPACAPFLRPGTHIDGTQWTSNAHGKNLDESLLHHDFFPALPTRATR